MAVQSFKVFHEKVGIATHGNPITLNPGTLRIGKNLECVRDGVYRKPRGRALYGSGLPAQNISQVLSYKDKLLTHMSNNSLYYDNNSVFTLISSSVSPPSSSFRIKAIEQNGNLYFTTSAGIKKLSSFSSTVLESGISRGLDFTIHAITGTLFDPADIVAYRHLWSLVDENNNKIFGAPSERLNFENEDAVNPTSTLLRINIPEDITPNHLLEVFRTTIATGGVLPPENFQLVYQAHPTEAEITSGFMVIEDQTPEGFRGLELYTNTTQEGIENANDKPPKAQCIATYKDYTFYGNTESIHRLYTNLLSVANLVEGTSNILITDGVSSLILDCRDYVELGVPSSVANSGGLCEIDMGGANTLANGDYVIFTGITGAGGFPAAVNNKIYEVTVTGVGTFTIPQAWVAGYTVTGGLVTHHEDVGATPKFLISQSADIALAVDETARSIVKCLNQCSGNTTWDAYYISGYEDVVGKILITSQNEGAVYFSLSSNNANTANSFSAALNWDSLITNCGDNGSGLVRVTTASAHGLSTGSTVIISGVTGTTEANGTWEITTISPATFDLPVAFVHAYTANGNVRPMDYSSTNDYFVNGLMYSKAGQPEHVPLTNLKRIGTGDDPIIGLVGLKDSLFIIKKKDGVYRLTGDIETGFSIEEFDGTVECIQPSTITKGQNAIYMMTTLGFAKISDVGVEVIGRSNEFKDLIPQFSTNFEFDGYGWFYEEEKTYFVATHSSVNSIKNDITLTYNVFTDAWMHREHGIYTDDYNINMGIVINGIMYTTSVTNHVYKERKSYTSDDFALSPITRQITAINDNTITINTALVIPRDTVLIQGLVSQRVTEQSTPLQLKVVSDNNLATNVNLTVSNCVGPGRICVTTTLAHGLVNGNGVDITGVVGTTEANGSWIIEKVSNTEFYLLNSTFLNAYTSGGTVTNEVTLYPGIESTLLYQRVHCALPDLDKKFLKLVLFFDNDETSVTNMDIVTSTDLDTTEETTEVFETSNPFGSTPWGNVWGTPSVQDRAVILLPERHSTGGFLDLKLIHRRPFKQVALCGYSLFYDAFDTLTDT